MKNIILKTFVFCLFSYISYSQDVGINVLSVPSNITTNQSGKILVTISNNNGGTVAIPSYKIRPLISVPGVTITGVSDLPAGWSICSNDGNNIRLSNGTNNLAAGEQIEFNIDILASNTTGNFSITSTMSFGGGNIATACNNGAQTPTNNTANDNSTSAVTVATPLPLNLINFKAKQFDETSNLVSWKTANEHEFDGFTLRSSTDGKVFSEISKIKGGLENGEYEFKDDRYTPGTITYYQLKMTDLDGTYKQSKIISVDNRENFWKELVYPNPSSNGVYFIKSITNFDSIYLVTNSGVKSEVQFNQKNGLYQIAVDKNLPSGSYNLVFKKDDVKYDKKVILN